jgi:hypothetical protein
VAAVCAGAFGDDLLQRGPEGLIAYVLKYGTWPSSDLGYTGVKDANDAAFAAIIAHPARDWLECGLGNPAAMDTVKGAAARKVWAR